MDESCFSEICIINNTNILLYIPDSCFVFVYVNSVKTREPHDGGASVFSV